MAGQTQPLDSRTAKSSRSDRLHPHFPAPEVSSQAAIEDLLSRLHSFKALTGKITDWYSKAWGDMYEELSVLVGVEGGKGKTQGKYEDLSREFQIKGSVFEGLFASMKRSVMSTEAMIANYCFKRRGKYSEAECKQGVGMALERLANEIWKLVSIHVQKPVHVRASEALQSLSSLKDDADTLVLKLKEAQTHFEEAVKRHLREVISVENGTGKGSREENSGSEEGREVVTAELTDQSNRLMRSFQKYSSRNHHQAGNFPIKQELGSVLRDMAALAKANKQEGVEESSAKLGKQLIHLRTKVDLICRTLEGNAGKQSEDGLEVEKLKELVRKQTEEIEKLKAEKMTLSPISKTSGEGDKYRSQTPEPVGYQVSPPPEVTTHRLISEHLSYQVTPPEPISYKEDFDKLNQAQISMLSDLKNLQLALEKISTSSISPSNSLPSPRQSTEKTTEMSLILLLKSMRIAAPHIKLEDDVEMAHEFIREALDMKEQVRGMIEQLKDIGCEVNSVKDVIRELVKVRKELAELREEHDELVLKVIKVQSEAELNATYNREKVQELEKQLEEARKSRHPEINNSSSEPISNQQALKGLLAALPKLVQNPAKTPHSSSHHPADSRANFYEDEIAFLSSENFALLSKLEAAGKEKSQLQRKIEILDRKVGKLRAVGSQENPKIAQEDEVKPEKMSSGEQKSSFESAPGGTEEALDSRIDRGKGRFKKISILDAPSEEQKSESSP